MEKTYDWSGYQLVVWFEPKLVRITEPKALKDFLSSDIEARSTVLVNGIKLDYLTFFKQEIKISTDSIIMEIWGHVFASYIAKALKDLVKLNLIADVADVVIKRSDTIDCGEQGIDRNRSFWDLMANFKNMVITFLPKRVRSNPNTHYKSLLLIPYFCSTP